MNKRLILINLLFFVCVAIFPHTHAFSYTDKDALNKEDKSLQEILDEEKTRQYEKIDDLLANFDKDYTKDIGEKFEDLLDDDSGMDADEDEEIGTDSFEEFNDAFDKMIEEDLADFDLIDIDAEDLEGGLDLKDVSQKSSQSEAEQGISND